MFSHSDVHLSRSGELAGFWFHNVRCSLGVHGALFFCLTRKVLLGRLDTWNVYHLIPLLRRMGSCIPSQTGSMAPWGRRKRSDERNLCEADPFELSPVRATLHDDPLSHVSGYNKLCPRESFAHAAIWVCVSLRVPFSPLFKGNPKGTTPFWGYPYFFTAISEPAQTIRLE